MRDDDEDGGGTMADEQAADLAALQAGAMGAQPPAGAVVAQGQEQTEEIPPPSAQAMALARMVVGIVRPLVAYAVPALRDAPDALWEPIPEGVAAVVDSYGGGAEWMRNPWVRLGFSTTPLLGYVALQAMNKPETAPTAPAAPPPGAPADPGSKTLVVGTVMPGPA